MYPCAGPDTASLDPSVLSDSRSSTPTSSTDSTPSARDLLMLETSLDPVLRSSTLQDHFHRMQKALNTCHPREISGEAIKVIRLLERIPFNQLELFMRDIATTLLWAGARDIKYSRSVALLAYEIYWELQSTPKQPSMLFQARLADFLKTTLELYFYTPQFEGLGDWHRAKTPNALSAELTLAAFAGSVYSMGLITVDATRTMISWLSSHFTYMRCQALYMLMLHAKSNFGLFLGTEFLLSCRRRLVWWGMSKELIGNPDAQMWILEICDTIDQLISRDLAYQSRPQEVVVFHFWDQALLKKNLLCNWNDSTDELPGATLYQRGHLY